MIPVAPGTDRDVRVLAHGVGSAADLPLPLDLVLQAGAATVVLSFLIVAIWWRRPRLTEASGDLASDPDDQRERGSGRRLAWLRGLVLLLSVYLLVNAFTGPHGPLNPAAHALFVWLWVGLVPVSVVFGPVWRSVNPLRTVFRILRLPAGGLRPLPPGTVGGSWPAAVFLLVFVWFELIAPDHGDPRAVGAFLAGYAAAQLFLATLRGQQWFARGDCFEVYSTLAGRLSPFRRLAPLRRRKPLSGLGLPLHPGFGPAAFLAVWWGSTVFDSATASPWWAGFVQRAGHPILLGTITLVLICAVVFVAGRRVVASLIPIAVGYTLAHYLSLLLVEGPRGVLLLAGSDARWDVVPLPEVVAGAQIVLILAGHALGVIVAHDRALADAPDRPPLAVLADEMPLALFMIGCTWAGLFLLFAR
ncbi:MULTISPECIES: hypothetical protein [Actinoplanes]|uniref:hypothetical protein n=1 Tax=Actinoplanes TaxID=1865 RepID=UPI0005F2E684|nr:MULTISPECIES: hypothetical protein [Actinoplanes]GLY06473.1 hypothetical protein Acsp01_68520 [Actinoplanes sp. NBRC 101535]